MAEHMQRILRGEGSAGSEEYSLSDSAHVSAHRAVQFLLEGAALDLWEHEHLTRCTECRQAMSQAASQKLATPETSEKSHEHEE